MLTPINNNACGNCRHFLHEIISGYGYCNLNKINVHCGATCPNHKLSIFTKDKTIDFEEHWGDYFYKIFNRKPIEMKPKYRIGRANHCAILYVETGKEYLVFPRGKAEHIDEFCKWLNDNDK